jgi:hypothetical protein
MKENKRKEERYKEENIAVIAYISDDSRFDKGKTFQALTKDVSSRGVNLLCANFFPEGSMLQIKLTLSKSRKILNLKGQVRWIRDVQDGEVFEIGIEFMEILPQKTLILMEHIFGKEKV